MKPVSLVAGLLLLLTVGLAAAAVALAKWYEISEEAGGQTFKTEFGLFKSCAMDECRSNDFGDISGQCDRSGSQMSNRINAVIGLTITCIILAFIGAVLAFAAAFNPVSIASPVSLLFSILAAATIGCGVALFVYTTENWYFCDKTYCEFSGSATCSSKFGAAFYLAVAAIATALLAFVCQIIAVLTAPKATEETPASAASPQHAGQSAQSYGEPYNQPSAADATWVPPQGDWVLDEASGLYWSDSEYLYLEPATNHYYDPKSRQWYDPDRQEWYMRDP